jgi:uncharacterized membrane protein YdfJ with MMPL/SSD domain
MSTKEAVAHGLATTAGPVNSAAIVMVAVFAIFATLSSLEFKQLGVGLAAAVLIDATLIRCVLLPAAMALLGEANWYLPRWMGRLRPHTRPPHVDITDTDRVAKPRVQSPPQTAGVAEGAV